MDTTLILTGVACVVAAIIGGGVKLLQVEVRVFDSLHRQSLLGLFGAGLILAGLIAGGHLRWPSRSGPAAVVPTPSPSATGPSASPTSPPTTPTPVAAATRTQAQQQASPTPVPSAASASEPCDTFAGITEQRWRERYFRPVEYGTFHIFVQTLAAGEDEGDALSAEAAWRRRFAARGLWFETMSTGSLAGGNSRWAVVVARGLDKDTAVALTRFVKLCGIEASAFVYQQQVGPAGF